jgi:hypothetical protein
MATSIVSLVLLGQLRDLQVVELDPVPAPLTRVPLRRISFTLRVRDDEEHERLEAELAETADGPAVIVGAEGVQWEVTSRMYSYRDGMPAAHEMELTERQGLTFDRMEFGGLVLTPERWSLGSGGDPALTFLASMSAEQHQQFEQELEKRWTAEGPDVYFPVSMIGLTDQPIRVRFGRCLWQGFEGGGARHRIVLVPEEGDAQGTGIPGLLQLVEPSRSRLIEQSVGAKLKIDAVIEELQRAGVLAGDAIERIQSAADSAPFAAVREYDRVPDVEDFFS